MKGLIKLLFAGLFFVVAASSVSEAADGWYDGLKVTHIVVHGGYYLIETDSSLADCNAPGRFTIKGDAVMAKEMYVTAMSAYLTGKRINIYIDAAQGCLNSGMVATLISIHD
jgi:hypothetical protein